MAFVFSQPLRFFGELFGSSSSRLLQHLQILCQMWEERSPKQNLITDSSISVCLLGEGKYVRVPGRQEWDLSPKTYSLDFWEHFPLPPNSLSFSLKFVFLEERVGSA